MRIFLAIPRKSETHGGAFGLIWYKNFYETLHDLGYEVYYFDQDEIIERKQLRSIKQFEQCSIASQLLRQTFLKEHALKPFDLFFSYYKDGFIDVSVIDEIRKIGVPTCNFSCNNTHQFDLVDGLSPHFDYNLHSEKDTAEKFCKIGANAVWFPMAANPKYYRPYNVPRTSDVSFVGQCYARRPYYIWHLLENDVDVKVYGPGWLLKQDKTLLRRPVRWIRRANLLIQSLVVQSVEKRHTLTAQIVESDLRDRLRFKYFSHLHNPVSDDEMILKYSESKISLGFLEVYDAHNPAAAVKQHLHLREFEAPMCGALYFTGWCEELAEFFEPDKEIVVYHNEHELLDKIRYYLGHPADAERVRQAGYMRAQNDHTYQKRFQGLFEKIGIQR